MLRRLALLLIPALSLATACGDGDGEPDLQSTPRPTATAAVDQPTEVPEATPTPMPSSLGKTDPLDDLFGTLNPLDFVGGLSGAPSFGEVDPALGAALLTAGDLPGGFASFGEFAYELPGKYGTMQMAANVFSTGDPSGDEFGTMVMSAAVRLPPAALAEFSQENLAELAQISEADLQELQAATAGLGFGLSDLRLLDAGGLGEGGLGMHLVMDLGGLLDAFGAPPGSNPFEAGIAMDVYMFVSGDRLLMTMVMWPADESSGVDSRGLADAVDARAGG